MKFTSLFATAVALTLACSAHAGFIIQADSDGLDDGTLVPSPNFALGANTPAVSTSSPSFDSRLSEPGSPVLVPGLVEADSIFGGTAPSGGTTADPDTYQFFYSPAADGDNDDASLTANLQLNSAGDFASGLPSGGSGTYAVYAAWPASTNISNSPTNWELSDGSSVVASTSFDQNGLGGQWVKLFEVALDASLDYTLTQTNTPNFTSGGGFNPDSFTNGFVSQRADGVLFDLVPEPTSAVLAALGMIGLGAARRS
ncbi:MAG: PEP-CTERM sorting domain-containing protein [Planctomycetota bacterium]